MIALRAVAVRTLASLALTAALLAALGVRAEAATIQVNTFAQVDGPGCTLADAINSANANVDLGGCTHTGTYGADTIVLPTGTYPLTAADNEGTNGFGANGLPIVTSDITILGQGSTISRINGASAPFFRIFQVTQGTLTLVQLTVTGGFLKSPGNVQLGGGIHVEDPGSLTLSTVTVSGNTVDTSAVGGPSVAGSARGAEPIFAGFARGGGINFQGSGVLALTDTDVIGNSVLSTGDFGVAQGGGIATNAPLAFTRGHVLENVARADAGAGAFGGNAQGGGISVAVGIVDALEPGARAGAPIEAATLALSGVIVSLNQATAEGGGDGSGGNAEGGGVFYQAAQLVGGLAISDSSVTLNRATAGGGAGKDAGSAAGGGIYYAAFGGAGGGATIQRAAIIQNFALADGGTNGAGIAANGGDARGGGIRFESVEGNLALTSVTLSANIAQANPGAGIGAAGGLAAGGAVSFHSGGVLTVLNAMVNGNSVFASNGVRSGGGIEIESAATIQNSIVIGNSDPSNCAGTGFTSLGHNIIPSTGCGSPVASDKPNAAPQITGSVDLPRPAGYSLTLAPTSPAIDAGDPTACPPTDQLGQSRAGTCDIGATELVGRTAMVASILPSTRSGKIGTTLTAFVSVINTGATTAFKVILRPTGGLAALFAYQTTDPQTNALTGTLNTPVDIPPGQIQTYVIALTPYGAFDPTDLELGYEGTNTDPVAPISGLNTLLVSAALEPIPDLVALAATAGNNGIVDIPGATGTGAFSVATVNLGAPGQITASADTGGVALPLTLLVCQTNPATGLCVSPVQESVTILIGAGETPTFAVFAAASASVTFDPAHNRIFFRLKDTLDAIRGGTSVAPRTIAP